MFGRTLLITVLLLPAMAVGGDRQRTSSSNKSTQPGSELIDLPKIEPGPAIQLGEALKLAAERNLSIKAIETEIASARARLELAWSDLIPTAWGSLTWLHKDHEDSSTASDGSKTVFARQDRLTGEIVATVPVVDANNWLDVGVQRKGLAATEASVELGRQQLLLEVGLVYYQALSAKALIDAHNAQLISAARHLAVSRARVESGVGDLLDVLRTRSTMEGTKVQLLSAHSALSNTRDTLGRLIGAGGLPMPSKQSQVVIPTGSEGELIDKALADRQVLKEKYARERLAEKRLDAAWMQFVPTLDLSWYLTHNFSDPAALVADDRTRWRGFLTLTVPFYNGHRYADLDANRAALTKAKFETEDAAEETAVEVRTLRRNYLTALQQISAAASQADLSAKALILAEIEYASGTGSSLAVTDARRESLEADIDLVTQRFRAQSTLLRLLLATGHDMAAVAKN